ncbi:MAG TPA: pyruvate dehydrogenase [Firmicutes bacterium]|nr:pyruvate dehydrogenase [Bacillota bacterium]
MVKAIDVLPVFEKGEIELGRIPKFLYDRHLQDEIRAGELTPQDAMTMLKVMLIIRHFEDTIVKMKAGKFSPREGFKFIGATHLSIGQEAVAVGAMSAITRHDYITSTHRGHGHSIAKGFFALLEMSDEELRSFINDVGGRGVQTPGATCSCCGNSRATLLQQAIEVHIYRTFAELFGKEDGYCRGRGGGMHIADFHVGHLGANAIVGGSSAIATGAAISIDKQGQKKVVLCLLGDGALNNGVVLESLNMACMSQFKRGTPVVYIIENNQYGMTGQAIGEVTGLDYLARRAAGFNLKNMNAEVVCGMDALAVRDAVKRAKGKALSGEGPVLLECVTYRYMGHSLSDDGTKYRSPEEVAAWKAQDAIERFKQELIDAGVASAEQIASLEREVETLVREASIKAAAAEDPDPKTIYEGLWADTSSENLPESYRSVHYNADKVRRFPRNKDGEILYRNAVFEALMEEMIRDKRVVLFGEDVAAYGGAFQVTHGLYDIFGEERVYNTAISEAAIVGSALGMAMTGLRPVAEIMYIDFILQAMDQVGNQVAKTRYMFAGKPKAPMVIRTTVGGGKGYAGQHSQSLEAVVTQFPGIKVVAPSTAYDVKGLLKTAIRDDNPVLFIEHQLLYTEKGRVPEEEYTIPFGQAVIRREGTDITIVAYSYMARVAERAAEILAGQGISVELVDPRTLVPLDIDTIVNSVKKTGRAMVLSQAPKTGCFGEHIAYEIQNRALAHLKAPVEVVAAHEVPPPMARTLEEEHTPSPEKVARVALRMLGR